MTALDISDGRRTFQVVGSLTDRHGFVSDVTTTRVCSVRDRDPVPGDLVPASWRRGHPRRLRIHWAGEPHLPKSLALAERDARAVALGIDPSGLPRGPEVLGGLSGFAAFAFWATSAAPLPDGTRPVDVVEADRLLIQGEPCEAIVLAIDFLRLARGVEAPKGASIANARLSVQRADGTEHQALVRLGFRTPERRAQIGMVGARIPVRVDPDDPSRVALDRHRLPRLTDQ